MRTRLEAVRRTRNVQRYAASIAQTAGTEPVIVETTLTPLLTADGHIEAILVQEQEKKGQGRDRAETATLHHELRVSEQRFRALAEALPELVFLVVPGVGAEYLSPDWESVTGRPRRELLGWGLLDSIHPDDASVLRRTDPFALADRRAAFVFRLRGRDGAYRWMESHQVAVRDAESGVRYVVGGASDITARREGADAARATAEMLEVAMDVTGMGRYVHYVREGRVVSDARANAINGYDVARVMEAEGFDGVLARVEPDDRVALIEGYERALAGQPENAIEYRVRRADGEVRWLSTRSRIESDAEGPRRIIGVVEDITERRAAEERRAMLQKREALGTIVGGLAHDFNNVLSAILSNASLARHQVAAGETPDACLLDITRAADRAAALVRRMLDYAREDSLGLVPVDLGTVVSEVAELVRPALPGSVRLELRGVRAGIRVTGDSNQLHQVLMNLLTNAQQSIGDGPGQIEVALAEVSAGSVELTVSDDGGGMPAEVARRIFDPFFTTKPPGEGTGLGLAAVHTIVARHGGRIDVETAPGRGATFRIVLRRADDPAIPGEEGGDAAPVDVRALRRVLFVDDDPALTPLVALGLEHEGCAVDAYDDPCLAAERFEREPDRFDVLVTDQTMPRMTGLDLIARLRALRPDLPTVLASGYLSDEHHAIAEQLAVDAIVTKPYTPEQVAAEVRRITRDAEHDDGSHDDDGRPDGPPV